MPAAGVRGVVRMNICTALMSLGIVVAVMSSALMRYIFGLI